MSTARETICVIVDEADEVAAVADWLERWRPVLTFCSENRGCGCCADIWDVEGPEEAIDAIPEAVRTWSDWSRSRPRP